MQISMKTCQGIPVIMYEKATNGKNRLTMLSIHGILNIKNIFKYLAFAETNRNRMSA